METPKWLMNPIIKKMITFTICAVILYHIFRFLLPLFLPFVIAGIVSVVYYPVLRRQWEQTKVWNGKVKKWLLISAVVLLYTGILCIFSLLGRYLFGQGRSILLNFPFYQAKILYIVKNCCGQVDSFLQIENGVCYAYLEELFGTFRGNSLAGMLPKVTTYSVQMADQIFQLVFSMIVTVIATFFMFQDYDEIREHMMQSEPGKKVCLVMTKCKVTLKTYLKAQGLILLLDGILCTVAFLIICHPYAFMLGSIVAVVDALPVLGAGLVLLPYIFYLFLSGKKGMAAILLLAYAGCLLIRQIIEPRMIGDKIGIKPLYTIIGMYVGFRLFGIAGFLLGPVGIIIGKEVLTER